jgi:hypothetical protein
MVVIIALVNTRMSGTIAEGFDCASDAELLDTPFDTGVYIDGIFNLLASSNIMKGFSNDDIKRLVAVFTNIYKTFETTEISPKRNPFYGTDMRNPPKPCGCYMTIAQNFDVYYLTPKRYHSSNQTEYFSVLRYFFDVEDSANGVVYTGLGNYKGAYSENYYNEFFKESYTVPSEITNEPTNLMNPGFKYHLNYFTKYLLIHTQAVNKQDMMEVIVKLSNKLLSKYTGGTYDKNLNPFPGKKMHVTDLQKIVKKARSKTFTDSNSGEVCSGSKLNANAQKILNAITDKKYFVAYLKGVIQAIQRNTSGTTGEYHDWDPNGLILNNVVEHDAIILSDTYLLSNSVDNVYNLMEQFGHFDPLTNTYTLNTTGILVIQQMSVDVKKCVVDYLEKMCVLAFAPIQYGGEVNYDRWGFF